MKTLSTILGALAFSAIYVSCEQSGPDANSAGIIFGLILFSVAGLLYSTATGQEQDERNLDADVMVRAVLAGKQPWYYLYLRPFSITNKFRMSNPAMTQIQDRLKPQRVQNFEAVLQGALNQRGIPLMGFGEPGEAIGAARIKTTEEDWQATFEVLANAASGFIVVPALSSGTWWEIKWLVDHNMIPRTVFICPQALDTESAQLLATEYRRLGLNFPEDGAKSILKLAENGEVIARVGLDALWTSKAGAVIQEMKSMETLRPDPGSSSPLAH